MYACVFDESLVRFPLLSRYSERNQTTFTVTEIPFPPSKQFGRASSALERKPTGRSRTSIGAENVVAVASFDHHDVRLGLTSDGCRVRRICPRGSTSKITSRGTSIVAFRLNLEFNTLVTEFEEKNIS